MARPAFDLDLFARTKSSAVTGPFGAEYGNICQFLAIVLTLCFKRQGMHHDNERQPHPQLEDMVRQKVASGLYTSASEVIREALRLMDDQDRLRSAKLSRLCEDIQEGLTSGAATPWTSAEAKSEGRRRRAGRTGLNQKP